VNTHIGWPRAVVSGLAILVVGLGASVGLSNYVLTNVTGLSRGVQTWIATAIFLVVVVGMAFVLRRLQARGLI
jgi:hypothetical protein